jgi:hypothetical protein
MGEEPDEDGAEDWDFQRLSPKYTEEARGRDPGLLTYADREYLLGEKEVTGPSETQLRQRLRDRIRNGLLDFELLLSTLDDQDIRTIFSNVSEDYRAMSDRQRQAYDGAKFTLAFLYFGISEFAQMEFEDLVESAIEYSSHRGSERRRGPHQWRAEADVNINVDWDIRAWRNDKLMEKLHSDEYLDDRELGMIVRFGDLDEEDWELIREEVAEGPPPGMEEMDSDDGTV